MIMIPKIKVRAGTSTRGRTRRDPYTHLTISWPPDQTPTTEEATAAAREALAAVGIGPNYHGVLAIHDDQDHRHIHASAAAVQANARKKLATVRAAAQEAATIMAALTPRSEP